MTAVCPFCSRRVAVTVAGANVPWFKKHRVGRRADRRGGDRPSTTCPGSFMAAPTAAAAVTLIKEDLSNAKGK